MLYVASLVVSQTVVFASICPHCKREQRQDGFTVADLMGLLYSGYAIAAYCAICAEFWPISVRERVELGAMVAGTCGRSSLDADDHRLSRQAQERNGHHHSHLGDP